MREHAALTPQGLSSHVLHGDCKRPAQGHMLCDDHTASRVSKANVKKEKKPRNGGKGSLDRLDFVADEEGVACKEVQSTRTEA